MLDECREKEMAEEVCFEEMHQMYLAMKESDANYDPKQKSNSGLVGGEAEKFKKYVSKKESLCGDFLGNVIQKALRVAESNACMKRIVAAPTAGSCGVLPAVFIAIQERDEIRDEKMTEALFVAAGIGGVIASKASLAGAQGGCQAEIGSASSMAGIESKIPADEVFEAMNSISKNMSDTIKETAEGGLAQTPAGLKIAEEFYSQSW